MFRGRSAWFSDSVRADVSRFWVSQGGVVSSWRTADYLFSDDASFPDTKRIHGSEDYAMDRATVFHSDYLSTCRLRQSVKSVPLGHYLLPPVSVQTKVRSLIGRFIWEQEELLGEASIHGYGKTEQAGKTQPGDDRSSKRKGKISQEDYMNTPSRDETICCDTHFYPVNNMVSGYIHADQLEKYSGELEDFLPSCPGYVISRNHSRKHAHQHKLGQF